MKYRRLGSTGVVASVIGLGTWQFGGEWGKSFTQSEVALLVGRAAEVGINLIDTAECYGDHLSESLIGASVRLHRDSWIIATKFGHRHLPNFRREQLWTAADVLNQLESSLRALHTDYVDLYQFHSGSNEDFDRQDVWIMLQNQVKRGKIRHLGISISPNTNSYQTDRAASVGAETIQVLYNRLDRQAEETVLPSCARQNLGVLARVPLASGFLSGKYAPGTRFAREDDVRSSRDAEDTEERLLLAQRILGDEVPAGVLMSQWALAWCLQHPAVTSVIPGCKTPEQMSFNAAAADLSSVSTSHPQSVAPQRGIE